LFLPYSSTLNFNKKPYVTYFISILCLVIYYAQYKNEININIAAVQYCESISIESNNNENKKYDLLANNVLGCSQMLTYFYEHKKQGAIDYIKFLIIQSNNDSYSLADVDEIYSKLNEHLIKFKETAPTSYNRVLMHYPNEFNPFSMITSSVAHGNWSHVFFNLIFFMAFAPGVEIVINNRLRYIAVLLGISLVTGVSYSLVVLMSGSAPLPTLGLSGVVMGMIGMSAYLMPYARVKVIFWFIFFIRVYKIPVWILAVWFVGWDTLEVLFSDDYDGVNFVAHVSGGFSGYLMALMFFKKRRDEIQDELNEEIVYAKTNESSGMFNTLYSGGRAELFNEQQQKQFKKNNEDLMENIHRFVRIYKDSDAINLIVKDYETQSSSVEIFIELFERIKDWGDSLTLLCVGRLIINLQMENKKYASALLYVEKCQKITEDFVLADPKHVLILANMARKNQQFEMSYLLVKNASERYGEFINFENCSLLEIELLSVDLKRKNEAKERMREVLVIAEGDFKRDLMKLAVLMS